jgi:sugar lactone lactonase YvrE
MSVTVEVVANTADELGESAIWDARAGRLWWVDMRAPALHGLDPATGEVVSRRMPGLCPAVLPRKGGGVMIAVGLSWFDVDPVSGALAPLIAVEPDSTGNRINDSRADRVGRLWTSTMRDRAAATTGTLYRFAGRRPIPVLSPVTTPNALCFSPSGDRVWFADTVQGDILVASLDTDGVPGAFRVAVPAGVLPGKPDGACVDAAGHVWSARYGGSCVVRIAPDGTVTQTVAIPATQVTSCAFGGEDLRTLYVTTARQRLAPAALANEPLAGALFACRPGVRGLPETPCDPHR